LIEAVTYRIGAHTTADDPTRYRAEKEVEEWETRDPITRYRRYLHARHLWSDAWEEEITTAATYTIEAAVEAMEQSTPPVPEDLFRYTFAQPTPPLLEQQAYLLAALRGKEE
jgi:pyruvate dehydrogenase E1 component alpha subunit